MTLSHHHRQPKPVKGQRKARKALPEVTYPAGFFSELVKAHNWPPRFESRLHAIDLGDKPKLGRPLKHGGGWGNGTIPLPGTPMSGKPAWMPRPRAAR